MSFHHPKLQQLDYREPGPLAYDATLRLGSRRTFSLALLPKPQGQCAWCNERQTKGKRKYCSEDCQESAYIYSYPQSPASKMFVFLQRQGCVCLGCGECFDCEITRRIEGCLAWIERHAKDHPRSAMEKPEFVTFHSLGNGTGELWHVDHILPIFKGGQGVGLENIQVLCVPCHKQKTVRERSTA